jgi:acetyl esterase/lipase
VSRLADWFSHLPLPNPSWLTAQVPDIAGYTDSRPDVTERRGVAYGSHDRNRLDVYTPAGKDGFPVVVFAPGGSWVFGSRGWYSPFGRALASVGIGCAIADYRLSPAVKHPAHSQDFAAAVAWVHHHLGEIGAAPDRLFLGGHSAGGYLAAIVALDPTYLNEVGLSPKDVAGVIGVSGIYRLNRQIPGFAMVFGSDYGVEATASPISHVRGGHPPFLALYAKNDYPTFDRQAEDLAAALRNAGCRAEAHRIDGPDHVTLIVDAGLPDGKANGLIRQFVSPADRSGTMGK